MKKQKQSDNVYDANGIEFNRISRWRSLESKVCVGWDWFKYKYMDNDPEDKNVDPSNRDSNKGIVSNRYRSYNQLLGSIKELNQRSYGLVEFFDHLPRRAATANSGEGD